MPSRPPEERRRRAGASVGRLSVVGTGIRSVAQTTREAADLMAAAEKLLYIVADPITEAWMRELNATAESLHDAYAEGKPRRDSYKEMVERILAPVREGRYVVAAFYGHPGVFVYPSHEAVRIARGEGFEAEMLPGISAEDCLFADLGIDPAEHGCCTFEATDFLVSARRFDPCSHLILWQIGVVGETDYRIRRPANDHRLVVLTEVLLEHYPAMHEVVIYEGAQFVVCPPRIRRVPLAELPMAPVEVISTLYVPPRESRFADREMLKRLGMAIP